MSFQKFYKSSFATLFLSLFVLISTGFAQTPTLVPFIPGDNRPMSVTAGNNLSCAGFIQTSPVDTSFEIVGAQEEKEKRIFSQDDNLFISAGTNRNVKVGDIYSVIRPRGQFDSRLTKKRNLGFYVQEVGLVEVIKVKTEVSVVRVKMSCDNFLLGDLLQPVSQRTSPAFVRRPALDLFGEPSGKASGRIVLARDGQELIGREQIVYVDLGAEDNVRVGDYLTIYRPLGAGNISTRVPKESIDTRNENYESRRYQGGKFSNQASRKRGATAEGSVVTSEEAKTRRPNNLREIVGEMIILNVKEKTATAVITRTATEIHTGDSVEMQ